MQPKEKQPVRESGILNNTDSDITKEIANGIKNIAIETAKSLELAEKEANAKKKEADEKKKKEIVNRTFNSIKKGSADAAVTGVKKTKGVAKNLLDSTAVGKVLGMAADFTGVSQKMGKKFDAAVDTVFKKDKKKKNDAPEKTAQAAEEISNKLSHPTPMPVDKDVKIEQEIQHRKEQKVFTEMRDYLKVIAKKGTKDSTNLLPDGKKKERSGILSSISEFFGKKLFGKFGKLGRLLFKPFIAISGLISKPLSAISGKLGNVFSGVSGKIGSIFTGKDGFLSKLSGMFSGKDGLLSKFGKTLKGSVGDAGSKVLGVAGKVGGFLTKGLKFLGPVGAALGVAATGLSGFMDAKNIFGKDATIGNKISATIGGIASGLTLGMVSTDTMAKGIQGMADSISDGVSWIGDKLKDGAAAYGKTLTSGADWLGEKLGFGTDAFSSALSKGSDYLKDTFKDGILNGFGNMIKDASKWYGDTLKSGADGILGVFGTNTDELSNGISKKFSDILGVFKDAGDWFGDKFNSLTNGAKDIAKDAWSWAKGLVGVDSSTTNKKNVDKKFKPSGNFLDDVNASIMKEETGNSRGTYNTAKDIGDGAGISFGAHQLTEKSGGIKDYLKEMSKGGDKKATKLLEGMGKGNAYKGDKKELIKYLKESGKTENGKKAQEKLYNKKYRDPALKLAKKFGITDPGAIAQIIDHTVNAGLSGTERMLKKANGDFSAKGIQKARKDDYRGLKNYKKYGKAWEGRVDRTADRVKQYVKPIKTVREAVMGNNLSHTASGMSSNRAVNHDTLTQKSVKTPVVKYTTPEKINKAQIEKQKSQEIKNAQLKVKHERTKDNGGMEVQTSVPIQSNSDSRVITPKSNRTSGMNKSSVSDSDLLLLSGVFLNK